MNIVFIGTVKFSLEMLTSLIESGENVVGVVTGDNKNINSDYADLDLTCQKYNIPCLVTCDVNSVDSISWIKSLSPEIIFCFGWSKLIQKRLLNLTHMGVIGYHPSALPKNRGRHPLIWALVLGLKKTASSFFIMDEGADSGDVVSQEEIIINDDDDAGSLYEKMITTARNQLIYLVPMLKNRSFLKKTQDHTMANVWRKRETVDGIIDWRMSATAINNLFRALAKPYVGAEFSYHDVNYKVWASRAHVGLAYENIEPGKVVQVENKKLIVKCNIGAIELLNVEPQLFIRKGEYL
jgi:methionyl-tRNA formyltransferase